MRREDLVVWRLTAAALDRIAGRRLTDSELERIGRAIGHSSIPEALEVIVDAVTGTTATDGGEDEA